jgi:hypothetical protein
MTSGWYAVKPMGMAGIRARACHSAIAVPQGLGFAGADGVQVHTTGNGSTERPTGRAEGSAG